MRACGLAAAGTGALALGVVLAFGCGGGQAPTSAAAERWRALARSTIARTEVAAARIGDGAYVVAGGEEDAGTIAEVEFYDPRTRRWRSEPPMRTPRHGLGAVSHGGRIVVLEGGPRPGLFLSDVTEALRVAP